MVVRNSKGQWVRGALKEKSGNWKGGKFTRGDGYVCILDREHPRANNGYVFEHIVVAEKKIGRRLNLGEIVHHINGVRDDNRPNNLIVMKLGEHLRGHNKHPKIKIDKELFKKHYFEGMSYSEMGKIFGCHKHTILRIRGVMKLPKRSIW